MIKLNVGCGADIRPGYVNLDYLPQPGVDLVHDLNRFPWPLEAESVEDIYASHVLEHVEDLIATMREIHRICAPGARLEVRVPHFSCGVTYRDPTHRRAFSYFTFDYFTREESYYRRQEQGLFRIESRQLNYTRFAAPFLNRLLNPIINLSPALYERFFCWMFPCSEALFVLRAESSLPGTQADPPPAS